MPYPYWDFKFGTLIACFIMKRTYVLNSPQFLKAVGVIPTVSAVDDEYRY
jgi:hypothetical protein